MSSRNGKNVVRPKGFATSNLARSCEAVTMLKSRSSRTPIPNESSCPAPIEAGGEAGQQSHELGQLRSGLRNYEYYFTSRAVARRVLFRSCRRPDRGKDRLTSG